MHFVLVTTKNVTVYLLTEGVTNKMKRYREQNLARGSGNSPKLGKVF